MKSFCPKFLAVIVLLNLFAFSFSQDAIVYTDATQETEYLKKQIAQMQEQLDSINVMLKQQTDAINAQVKPAQGSKAGAVCEAPMVGLGDEGLYETDVEADYFKACYKNITARFGGKYTDEVFVSKNTRFLNNDVPNDQAFYVRSTFDFYLDTMYGKTKRPRITSHGTLRLRYRWGSGSEIKTEGATVTLAGTSLSGPGSQINKHVMWVREAWMKVLLGDLDLPNDHFLQTGLIPYQAGRGISLGAAYKSGGFLGFSPGFSIDQFAPAALLHINPLPNKFFTEFYISLLENKNTSYGSNNEKIRKGEIDACPQRGTGRYGYVALIKGGWDVYKEKKKKLFLEPYMLFLNTLDQKLEFANDLDSHITTFGLMVEAQEGRVDWGFEAAVNLGSSDIKAWDRNQVVIVEDSDAFLVDQYTKVYTQDPATTTNPSKALDTAANKAILAGSPKTTAMNGQEIGSSGLWNAYDRFRPAQKKNFNGYFFVADGSYLVKKDVLKISLGAGYASGQLDDQENVNNMTSSQLMNQKFDGFVPLLSIYSGTRIRQLMVFLQGMPRFNTQNPNITAAQKAVTNINQPVSAENIEFTNIMYLGTTLDWKIEPLKKYKVRVEPNIIGYWIPAVPITASGQEAGNYLGVEWTTELSAIVLERLKLYGYIGLFFPGSYYKDMAGTPLGGEKTGSNMPIIVNIGGTYTF